MLKLSEHLSWARNNPQADFCRPESQFQVHDDSRRRPRQAAGRERRSKEFGGNPSCPNECPADGFPPWSMPPAWVALGISDNVTLQGIGKSVILTNSYQYKQLSYYPVSSELGKITDLWCKDRDHLYWSLIFERKDHFNWSHKMIFECKDHLNWSSKIIFNYKDQDHYTEKDHDLELDLVR